MLLPASLSSSASSSYATACFGFVCCMSFRLCDTLLSLASKLIENDAVYLVLCRLILRLKELLLLLLLFASCTSSSGECECECECKCVNVNVDVDADINDNVVLMPLSK